MYKKQDKITIFSSPARVCLYGDNVDWITGPALLCSLDNLRTFIMVKNNHFNRITFKSYNVQEFKKNKSVLNKDKKKWFHYPQSIIKVLKKKYKLEINGIDILVNSTLPIGAGLSSSAALCTAACGALNGHFKLGLKTGEIAHVAYLAERYELGIPCGQMDQYSVAFGGLLYVNCAQEPPKELEKFKFRDKFVVVIGDTQIHRNTSEVINDLKKRLNKNDPLIFKFIKNTEDIIFDARSHLKTEKWDLNQLGEWLNECHKTLQKDLLTSNEKLDLFTYTANKYGALGAKLTGAGRGGCMFAICKPENYKIVANKLKSVGAKVFIGYVSNDGLRRESLSSFQRSIEFSYSVT